MKVFNEQLDKDYVSLYSKYEGRATDIQRIGDFYLYVVEYVYVYPTKKARDYDFKIINSSFKGQVK